MIVSRGIRICTTALVLAGALPVSAASPEPGETLAARQTFTYRLLDEFPTLDPQLNEETEGTHVIQQIFEGLLSQDGDGNLVPGVAESYSVSADNKVYTFRLRPTAKWSNGEPVTAGDFVYAWRRAVDPKTASPYSWYVAMSTMANAGKIVAGEMAPDALGVRALDPQTLEVTLEQSIPYFAAMTTQSTLFPAPRATIERFGAEWTRPGNIVSNGAYVLSAHVPNEYHREVKSETYWNADKTVITEITGLVVNDVNQALTRYLAGELDMTDMPAGQYPEMKAKYPDEAQSTPRLCSYYYAINFGDNAHPALRDVRVRKALSYAIDRDLLVGAVLKGGQQPAYTFAHADTAGFVVPEIGYAQMTQKDRDAEAVRLMTEAGYGKGHPITLRLIYNTDESHKAIATVLGQMWKQKLGVAVEMSNFEWKTYLDIRKRQEFDVARSAWCGDYNEASTFLDLLTTGHGSNDGRYSRPEVDALMTQSKAMSDPNPSYQKVEQLLAEDMAIIPLYHYTQVFMLKPDIRGWPFHNVENNWYIKDIYRVSQ